MKQGDTAEEAVNKFKESEGTWELKEPNALGDTTMVKVI